MPGLYISIYVSCPGTSTVACATLGTEAVPALGYCGRGSSGFFLFGEPHSYHWFCLFKPGVGQKIDLYLFPATRNSVFLISAFPVLSSSFVVGPRQK